MHAADPRRPQAAPDRQRPLYQRGLTILDEFRQLEAELEDISSVKRACCGWAFHRWWAGRSPI